MSAVCLFSFYSVYYPLQEQAKKALPPSCSRMAVLSRLIITFIRISISLYRNFVPVGLDLHPYSHPHLCISAHLAYLSSRLI